MDRMDELREFWTCDTLEDAATSRVAPDWPWPWDEQRVSATFDDVIGEPIRTGAWVMDYGCGVGRFSREAVRRGASQVIGVDVSPEMLRHATAYVADPRFIPVLVDEQATATTRCIDVSFSFLVMQHIWTLDGVARALESMTRPLRSGGWLSVQFRRGLREADCHGFDGVNVSETWVTNTLRGLGVDAHVVQANTLSSMPRGPGYDDWWFARGRRR